MPAEIFHHRLQIEAQLDATVPVREEFLQFLSVFDLTPKEQHAWELVFTEAINNAIKHGVSGDLSQGILLEWWKERQSIFLAIQDPGSGPSEERLRQLELPEDTFAEGGRGLYIIGQFATRWEHWRSSQGYRQVIEKEYEHLTDPLPTVPELEDTLEELSASYESLSAFYRLGEALISSESLEVFLRAALDNLKEVYSLDYLILVLSEEIHMSLQEELLKVAEVQPDILAAPPSALPILAGREEIVWDDRSEMAEDVKLKEFDAGCCLPVMAAGKIYGCLIAARHGERSRFDTSHLNSLRTFSDLFGIALVNQNLLVERDQEQRALRDLEIATEIQRNLLPIAQPPISKTWELTLNHKSAREVAGDYAEACYDADENLVFVMIDVMGKGVAAAMLATIFRTAFHINIKIHQPLEKLMESINVTLCDQLGEMTMFITCAIVRISPDLKRMEMVNAGHCPVLLMRSGGEFREIAPSGPPLGLFEDTTYECLKQPLDKRDGILLVTDGIFEWESGKHQWGWDHFIEFARERVYDHPDRFWFDLQSLIRKEAGKTDLHDDQTMLFWKMKG